MKRALKSVAFASFIFIILMLILKLVSADPNNMQCFGNETDDTLCLGGASGGIMTKGDFYLSTNGSTQSSPRTIGFNDFSSGEAARWSMGDLSNGISNAYGGLMQMYAYWPIRLEGYRTIALTPAPIQNASNALASVMIIGPEASTPKTKPTLMISAASTQSGHLVALTNNNSVTLSGFNGSGTLS